MDPIRKIPKKVTKKFVNKVINRQYFHRRTGLYSVTFHPVPTRLCHCDKSCPCLVGIGLILLCKEARIKIS